MFPSWTIKTRILGILALLAAGYLVLLTIVQISASVTHARMTKISTAIFPAALRLQEAEAGFERMKKHYQDAIVLQDVGALTAAESDADATVRSLTATRDALVDSGPLAGQSSRLLQGFLELAKQDHTIYAAVVGSGGAPGDALMGQMRELGKSNTAFSEAMVQCDKMIGNQFRGDLGEVDAWSVRSRLTGLGMLVFAVVICFGAWWVLQFQVVKPLSGLALRMKDIAEGEGDLTRRVPVAGRNEIDEVGIWFNVFLDKLQDVMRRVKISTERLTEASEALNSSAAHMAEGAEAQRGQTDMVALAMREMSDTVADVSKHSNLAAMRTRQAAELATDGGKVVDQTVGMMQDATQSVDQVAGQVAELGKRSNQIGLVIGVIDEIASRTNLLALNAAIEAARAGEQGRGFAVVAGEVRNLAERTTQATQEIAAMIGSIQSETRAAVEAMGQGTVHVRRGVASTGEAGVKLRQIIQESQEAAGMVNQIAAASSEQTATAMQVNQNITEIARISQETASDARESAKACAALSQLALDLHGLMGKFRVDEEMADQLA